MLRVTVAIFVVVGLLFGQMADAWAIHGGGGPHPHRNDNVASDASAAMTVPLNGAHDGGPTHHCTHSICAPAFLIHRAAVEWAAFQVGPRVSWPHDSPDLSPAALRKDPPVPRSPV